MALSSVLVKKLTYTFLASNEIPMGSFSSNLLEQVKTEKHSIGEEAFFYLDPCSSLPAPCQETGNRRSGPRTVIGPVSQSGLIRGGLASPARLTGYVFSWPGFFSLGGISHTWPFPCQRTEVWDSCLGFMDGGRRPFSLIGISLKAAQGTRPKVPCLQGWEGDVLGFEAKTIWPCPFHICPFLKPCRKRWLVGPNV